MAGASNIWRFSSSARAVLYMVLVLAAFVFITLLSERHYFRLDLTASRHHSLSEETINVLAQVKEPIRIKAFVRKGFREEEEAERLLSAYHYRAPKITYELIDPERNPSLARRYGVSETNTFVLEGNGQRQVVKLAEEGELTNAIIRILKGEKEKVYWLTGHGERDFRGMAPSTLSTLAEELQKQHFEFHQLDLTHSAIPADADMLVIAAPRKELFAQEIQAIRDYILKGGRVMAFVEPFNGAGLESLAAQFGIRLSNDVVVDKLSRVMGGDWLLPMVGKYGAHKITEGFNFTSMFHVARSVEPVPQPPKGVTVSCLAYTTANSWAETDQKALDQGVAQIDERDRMGPVCLSAISELTPPLRKKGDGSRSGLPIEGKGMLLIFGDVDFATNKYLNVSGNKDLVTNAFKYLAGSEPFIIIKKRNRPIQALVLTKKQGLLVFWVPVILIPVVVLVVGLLVWAKRRAR